MKQIETRMQVMWNWMRLALKQNFKSGFALEGDMGSWPPHFELWGIPEQVNDPKILHFDPNFLSLAASGVILDLLLQMDANFSTEIIDLLKYCSFQEIIFELHGKF